MNLPDFNFDKWLELAQNSPEAFECQRRFCIELLIQNGKDSKQLRELQRRIELERSKPPTPALKKTYLRLPDMMLNALHDLTDVLNISVSDMRKQDTSIKKPCAIVIPFRR